MYGFWWFLNRGNGNSVSSEREIVFSKKSDDQLDEIYNYVLSVSNDDDIAKKYINGLIDKTEILKKHAFVGRQLVLVDNIITQCRYIKYKEYLIFYRVDNNKVYIDRILHSKKDYDIGETNEISFEYDQREEL